MELRSAATSTLEGSSRCRREENGSRIGMEKEKRCDSIALIKVKDSTLLTFSSSQAHDAVAGLRGLAGFPSDFLPGGLAVIDNDRIPALLARLRAGDATARQELIVYIEDRLQPLAHRLLRFDFPRVGLHAETGDILNEALCRLIPYLEKTQYDSCTSAERFYGLAAMVTRHTLIDLARKHFGSLQSHPISDGMEATHAQLRQSSGFKTWRENLRIHELVERLPERERTVIEMSLYLNMGTGEIAKVLGVHAGTVSHRLASAKEMLGRMLLEDDRRAE